MSAVTNSFGISIELTPWTDKYFNVSCLHIYECLGGDLAKGYVELLFPSNTDSNNFITETKTGTLIIIDTKENGLSLTIPIFIKKRDYFKNLLKLDFVCCYDKSFFTEPHSTSFNNITEAINYLYQGKKDIRTNSDLDNNTKIYQLNKTDYDFCIDLAYSYKKNIVFSMGWEGFMIKDIIGKNSKGKDENNYNTYLIGQSFMDNAKPYTLNYNKYLNTEPYNPRDDEDELINERNMIYFDKHYIMGTDYLNLYQNRQHNIILMNSDLYTSLITVGVDMPNYKIGDILIYKRAENETKLPFKKFLVFSNEFFVTQDGSGKIGPHGFKCEWTTKLLGLDNGNWNKN